MTKPSRRYLPEREIKRLHAFFKSGQKMKRRIHINMDLTDDEHAKWANKGKKLMRSHKKIVKKKKRSWIKKMGKKRVRQEEKEVPDVKKTGKKRKRVHDEYDEEEESETEEESVVEPAKKKRKL